MESMIFANNRHSLYACTCNKNLKQEARVVSKVDNIIHWINHYPTDSMACFVNTYPLDGDLSGR